MTMNIGSFTAYTSAFQSPKKSTDTSQANLVLSSSDTSNKQTTSKTHSNDYEASPQSKAIAFPDLFSSSNFNFLALAAQLKPVNPAELPEEDYKQYVEMEQARIEASRMMLEWQYTTEEHPEPGSLPQTKTYAEVVVKGKVVATIDNQGVITTDKALSESVLSQLPDSSLNGPDLAHARAERLAQLFGGKVQVADSALTQLQFNALPKEVIKRTLDETAMAADPAYAMLQASIDKLKILQQQRQQSNEVATASS